MEVNYIIDSHAHDIRASHTGGTIADESVFLAFLSMYENVPFSDIWITRPEAKRPDTVVRRNSNVVNRTVTSR